MTRSLYVQNSTEKFQLIGSNPLSRPSKNNKEAPCSSLQQITRGKKKGIIKYINKTERCISYLEVNKLILEQNNHDIP